MSESSSTARRRHEYLPNRMFDPVANPFAVQNLLVKEEQVFALTPDERPEFGFESDPLISKEATAHPFYWAAFVVVGDGQSDAELPLPRGATVRQ